MKYYRRSNINYKIITDIIIADRLKWSDFVKQHPNGNIFQTPEFYQVLEKSNYYKPAGVIVLDRKRIIVGVLLGVLIENNLPVFKKLSSRFIIWGGPLVQNDDQLIVSLILNTLEKQIKGKIVFSQFRNIWDISGFNKQFVAKGYLSEDHLNIIINLCESWKDILNGIHKSRKRNFTKSRNKGTTFKELFLLNEIKEAYILIHETYKRIKLPAPDFSHFAALYKYFGKQGYVRFFGAHIHEKIIGIRVVLTFQDVIYDYYAGSSFKFRNFYPNDFLIMNILEWGHKQGFKLFDFGGAGKPGIPYSVRDYKLQFGKQIVNYGRFEKIHKPLIYKIAKSGLIVWQKLKK